MFNILGLCLLVAAVAEARITQRNDPATYDFIVVGSGAGGGPLAARLARAGYQTLLIEAGRDQSNNVNTTVPGFQGAVTEDPSMRWDFFVNHYQDQTRAQRDSKYVYKTSSGGQYVGRQPPAGSEPLGILYPRAAAVGGCTSHNALIWNLPHASDWDNIAQITGDSSWSSQNMSRYIDRIYEWLPTGPTDPTAILKDFPLAQQLAAGAAAAGCGLDPFAAIPGLAHLLLADPNDRILPGRDSAEGYYQIPMTFENGERRSVRDFITDTAQSYPLTVQTDTFVTKLLFDQSSEHPKAVGVEFLRGSSVYRASARPQAALDRGTVRASREIIISGGTFNTPQILKLSGIGPRQELEALNLTVLRDAPGVGINLQDRYEIPVTVKHRKDFKLLDGCTFDAGPHDECFRQWRDNPYIFAQKGGYASNGLVAGLTQRSRTADTTDVDLFTFGGPIRFQGYFPGWSRAAVDSHKYFSWYTLKAHTRNHAGTVHLRSTDPLDPPVINFNYFDTGTTAGNGDQHDLQAMVQAIRKSREALSRYADYSILGGSSFVEDVPGSAVQSDEALGQYVKDEAWGHHASCTCAIGADGDPNAVLDTDFRVRGVGGLRVVDASAFPRIPGVFIQAPIYMISEKAADVIIDAWKNH